MSNEQPTKVQKPKVTVDLSEVDGTWVVFVDTDPNEEMPTVRVLLNDSPIYENPEFPCEGVDR